MVPFPGGRDIRRSSETRGDGLDERRFLAPEPTVCVHLIDHVLELRLGRVLTQRPHDGAELLGGDGSVSVLVEQREGLLELWTGKGSIRGEDDTGEL